MHHFKIKPFLSTRYPLENRNENNVSVLNYLTNKLHLISMYNDLHWPHGQGTRTRARLGWQTQNYIKTG